ncbi:MFS transporter [Pseudomonas cavernae]|uniref:MFS transporter n=1 Tax=Pseudomonas cavernae TaxID=2320867 RepID=A0A385YWK2_9PSED|nr:MFS transporter [Pseudomonas cavernae]AYC31295.1 MFS transporter [Pseudomonas cavernae]
MRRWPDSLRALSHRNFRLYFSAQAISTLGNWIQQVALAWLVYQLTGSAALLGVTTCATLLPQLLVGPLAGAWIDRYDKRKLLILLESLLGLQAATLATLTATGLIGPTTIVVMAAVHGLLNAVDTPLRLSLVSGFVDCRDDLGNALALNATLFTLSRFVGPPAAGLLLVLFGEAPCFALNALSYLPLIAALCWVRMAPTPRTSGSLRSVFGEGLDYILGNSGVKAMLLNVLAVNLTASTYAVLLPVFASKVFVGDARTLGWLWGAAGLGSLAASGLLAWQRAPKALPRLIFGATLVSALAMLVFAFSSQLWLSLLAMAALGFGIAGNNIGTNITLQSSTPDALRGRVVAAYTAIRFGFEAIGGLLAGLLAAHLGASPVFAGASTALLAYWAWSMRRQPSSAT